MSKLMAFSQKQAARNEKYITRAETEPGNMGIGYIKGNTQNTGRIMGIREGIKRVKTWVNMKDRQTSAL